MSRLLPDLPPGHRGSDGGTRVAGCRLASETASKHDLEWGHVVEPGQSGESRFAAEK